MILRGFKGEKAKKILGLLFYERFRADWDLAHKFPMTLWTMYCLNVQFCYGESENKPEEFVIGTHSTHTPMLAYINRTSDKVQII